MKYSILLMLLLISGSALADDIGRMIYERKCFGCHSLDANRSGPLHRGLFGRDVAGVPGYRYSGALKKLKERGKKWDARSLDLWLKNPQAFAPGTKMRNRVRSAEDRRKIIQYLQSVQ